MSPHMTQVLLTNEDEKNPLNTVVVGSQHVISGKASINNKLQGKKEFI